MRRRGHFCCSLFIICYSLAACACANAPGNAGAAPVYLSNRAKYELLPAADMAGRLDTAMRFSAEYREKRFDLEAWVKADETGIDMAFFNSLGASLGEIRYQGGVASFDSSVLPASVKPEYVMADFQLCFYRADALSKRLGAIGLKFDLHKDSTGGETRRVFDRGNCIIEIIKDKGGVSLVNRLRGYSYHVFNQ
jgi:hypothetical protein